VDIFEVLASFAGSVGIVLSAQGMLGLCGKQRATIAVELTDPLGRYDFLWSEGRFKLISQWVQNDLSLACGALFLLTSLVLGSISPIHSVRSIWIIPAMVAGIIVGGFLIKSGLRRYAISISADAIKEQARRYIAQKPNQAEKLKQELNNWFPKYVGREVNLDS